MRSLIDSLTENAFTAMVNTTKLCYALHLDLAPSSSLSSSVFCNHMCFALAFAISRIPRTTHPTPPPPSLLKVVSHPMRSVSMACAILAPIASSC